MQAREVVHLVASLTVLTIAFTYPALGAEMLLLSAFGVGIGFLLHELAHKFTAQKYGFVADYEASPFGLFLAIGLAVLTNGMFIFAAPGAVMIRGKRVFQGFESPESAKEMAYISVAGALVNLIIAVSFYTGSLFMPQDTLVHRALFKGAFINVFLAGFNMIPFGPLDGAKVWRYNRILWAIVGIPAIVLFFFL